MSPIYEVEEDVHVGRRAFPEAQAAFAGVGLRRIDNFVDVGWYDTTVHPESGSFALVREGGPLEDLVGEVVGVTRDAGDRPTVYVYVVGAYPILDDIALARRAFLAVGLLTNETLPCVVEVIE